MKILWLTNHPIPIICKQMSTKMQNGSGWLDGIYQLIKAQSNLELTICFPMNNMSDLVKGNVENITFYGFPRKKYRPWKYDTDVEEVLKAVINEVMPEIVHIFGTEFPHSLSMTKVFNNPKKTIIHVQGLCSVIEKHYINGIPYKIEHRNSIRDFLRKDNIHKQQIKFRKRGIFETEALQNVNNICGRTIWDKACTFFINPKAKYFYCNEVLRSSFYENEWNLELCQRHTIFVSQCYYTIKGFHYLIEAMPYILKRFPDTIIYTTGEALTGKLSLKDRIFMPSYQQYLHDLIERYSLQENIVFLGALEEEKMCQQFLKANVFVSPSTIENSSNSVGEAMILGVPIVSSDVGGIKDLVVHDESGLIYQHDAPYMLAYHVCDIFENDTLALSLSEKAKIRAQVLYSKENNLNTILEIYSEVSNI